MKCLICNGDLRLTEEVKGSHNYRISSDGTVDYNDDEFYGISSESLRCTKCEATFGFEFNEEGKIEYAKVV